MENQKWFIVVDGEAGASTSWVSVKIPLFSAPTGSVSPMWLVPTRANKTVVVDGQVGPAF